MGFPMSVPGVIFPLVKKQALGSFATVATWGAVRAAGEDTGMLTGLGATLTSTFFLGEMFLEEFSEHHSF